MSFIPTTFKIGAPYRSLQADSPEEYLEAALQGERYLEKFRYETEDGVYWKQDPSAEDVSLGIYNGDAGVAYFYILLARATGQAQYRTIADKAVTYLERHWQDFLHTDIAKARPDMAYGFFGLSGIGMVLAQAYRAFRRESTKAALQEIGSALKRSAKSEEGGTNWSGSTAVGLDGGTILFLITVYELFQDQEIKELLDAAAEWYLKSGKPHANGGLEYNGFGPKAAYSAPNFEFGSSGSGYVLARLYDVTKDERFLQAAEQCAAYLETIRVPQKKGYLIPYRVGNAEPQVFYLSGCHGVAGTAKLYYKLFRLTGAQAYRDQIVSLVDGLEAQGAPERQSAGFWNSVTLCCGNAGLVQFFVGLYLAEKDPRWRDLAVRAGNVLLGERELLEDGSADWVVAFERIHPDQLSTNIGYYDGVSGIASALLQLYLSETGKFKWLRLSDDPFPEG